MSDQQQQLDFAALVQQVAAGKGKKKAPSGVDSLHKESEDTDPPPERSILSVTELTNLLARTIEADPTLGQSVTVEGELSNISPSARGHVYFTLKDANASVRGVLWASTASRLKFKLEDGMAVYLSGKLEIYKPSGTYSIVGQKIEPVGVGSLQLAFQQTKEKLDAEGLFSDEFKQDLPHFPERIGIITSRTGAVIHDMLRVIRQKNPMVDVLFLPATVQGLNAAGELVAAIQELNQPSYDLDVIILARGGGSFEDLFCFSEEPVVRAVFQSNIPIVTGIGHEPDFSLSDAAADYSAATPTAAADWVVPDIQQLRAEHRYHHQTLLEEMRDILMTAEYDLDQRATRFVEWVNLVLETEQKGLDQSQERFLGQFRLYFQNHQSKVQQHAAQLEAYSPLAIIKRGYGAVLKQNGALVRSVKDALPGERLKIKLSDGTLPVQVESSDLETGVLEQDAL